MLAGLSKPAKVPIGKPATMMGLQQDLGVTKLLPDFGEIGCNLCRPIEPTSD